jgi:mannosylglycoprotein endo-beta-mannosidase
VRRRRGHLTLRGVNYRPVVYLGGERLSPYSTSTSRDDARGYEDDDPGGMFLRRHYDLGVVRYDDRDGYRNRRDDGALALEILVLPPPFVGGPARDEDVQGGDHDIAKSGAIAQFAAGWDWIGPTPDRNVGIWDAVDVEWIAGDVRLHDLRARVDGIVSSAVGGGGGGGGGGGEGGTDDDDPPPLPLGDGARVSAWVDLSLSATLHGNYDVVDDDDGPMRPIVGVFEYRITRTSDPTSALAAGTIRDVAMRDPVGDYRLGRVRLDDVELWWPHTHSSRRRQPLYSVEVKFRSLPSSDDDGIGRGGGGGGNSSSFQEARAAATFGVRTISSFVHPTTKSFSLRVNGHPVFLAGGNWITTDQFLRHSNSPRRYLRELGLLRHAGINAVRVWGGGLAETSRFYDAADALGMLVYQEFWMTGDNNGRFAGSYEWPVDREAYLANVRDTIVRLRNHPSLFLYAGGNELYPIPSSGLNVSGEGSGVSPPRDIERSLRNYIADLDGERLYVTTSVTDVTDEFDNALTLGPKDGPYDIQDEGAWFERNPGFTYPLLSDVEAKLNIRPEDVRDKDLPYRNIGFQTEVGSVSHPELESLKRFMSKEALLAYPDCGERSTVGGSVHEEWTYYKYLPFTDDGGVDHICQFAFPPHDGCNSSGTSKRRMDSIEDYTWAAQLAQYFQYKSLVEGYSFRMWEWYVHLIFCAIDIML